MRNAILIALTEQPGTGAEVIERIREHGVLDPSPSEVYPLLQLLVDEFLAVIDHHDERRVYRLTEAGQRAAAEARHAEHGASASASAQGRSEGAAGSESSGGFGWSEYIPFLSDARRTFLSDDSRQLAKAGLRLGSAVAQLGQQGSPEQRARAAALLEETRREIYAMLSQS